MCCFWQEDLFQTPGMQEELEQIIDCLDTSIPETIRILAVPDFARRPLDLSSVEGARSQESLSVSFSWQGSFGGVGFPLSPRREPFLKLNMCWAKQPQGQSSGSFCEAVPSAMMKVDTGEHDPEKGLMKERTSVGLEGWQMQRQVDGMTFSMDGGQGMSRRALV